MKLQDFFKKEIDLGTYLISAEYENDFYYFRFYNHDTDYNLFENTYLKLYREGCDREDVLEEKINIRKDVTIVDNCIICKNDYDKDVRLLIYRLNREDLAKRLFRYQSNKYKR